MVNILRKNKHVCKLLAELTGVDRQVMREMIQRLEASSGGPGVDLRLTGEIYGSLHMKMRALGLDPEDTTPRELYQALLNLAALHDRFLAQKLGVPEPTNPEMVLPLVKRLVERIKMPKHAWVMKPVAAKKLLKATPPKQLMKALHYRSLDSMLKREPAHLLLTVARHTESAIWQQKFLSSYKKLKPGDFEVRAIEVEYLNSSHWQYVGKAYALQHRTNILHASEVGTIVMLPLPATNLPGITLMSLLLVLHYINEIRAQSTYLKFHHLQPNFAARMISNLTEPTISHATIAGQPIHWRVIHRYYGTQNAEAHPEIFQPHIQPEDMAYRQAEHTLFHLEPALHFWQDMDYVGLPQAAGGSVSFNLMDVAINLVNRLPYERRVAYHNREAVWNELHSRYVGQQALERHLLEQLDNQIAGLNGFMSELEFLA
jgi:hypothetical protein